MGPRTSFFNKFLDEAHAAVPGTTLREPLFTGYGSSGNALSSFSVLIYSLVNVRSDSSLRGKCLCNTSKGKNIGGHLGRKSVRRGDI